MAVAVAYAMDAGRAFGYDAAVTMENFVDGPPSWAFTRQVVWNNHPLFSLAAGFVADVTRSTDEAVMRAPAIAFSAAAVGLLTWRVAIRLSLGAGAGSGLVLATHPLLFEVGREVRGYSLTVLAVVVLGIAVFDVQSPVLGGFAAFVAVGTHAHAVIPVVAVVAYLVAERRMSRAWRTSLLAAALGAALVYAGTVSSSGRSGETRLFRPTYLLDATWELLGGSVVPALLVSAVVTLGLAAARHRPTGVGALAGTASAGLAAVWIAAPLDLYTRFIYWAIPAVALGVGWGIRRAPWSLGLVIATAVVHVSTLASHVGQDELPNRALAGAAGPDACMIGGVPEYMVWYADKLTIGDHCRVVAVPPLFYPEPLRQRARTEWSATCWARDGAEVRARTASDCP